MADSLLGRIIGGRYRVESVLGRGGFGVVYRGTHLDLERPVAIKTLLAPDNAGDRLAARFKREAQLQGRVRHPAIVRLLDFGREADGTAFMVQEFVDGITLAELVHRDGTVEVQRAVHLVSDILDGLGAAHRRGIVHRDLKPANLMVTRGDLGEEVRILDFGLAKMRDALDDAGAITATGQILGSPAFMAPEQIEQQPISVQTDLYAMGAVLFYLLTGHYPFSGSIRAILAAHLLRPVPQLPPHLPRALDAFMARAMSKEPEGRFATAADMKLALAAARGSAVRLETAGHEPPPPAERPRATAPVAKVVRGSQPPEGPGLAVEPAPPTVRATERMPEVVATIPAVSTTSSEGRLWIAADAASSNAPAPPAETLPLSTGPDPRGPEPSSPAVGPSLSIEWRGMLADGERPAQPLARSGGEGEGERRRPPRGRRWLLAALACGLAVVVGLVVKNVGVLDTQADSDALPDRLNVGDRPPPPPIAATAQTTPGGTTAPDAGAPPRAPTQLDAGELSGPTLLPEVPDAGRDLGAGDLEFGRDADHRVQPATSTHTPKPKSRTRRRTPRRPRVKPHPPRDVAPQPDAAVSRLDTGPPTGESILERASRIRSALRQCQCERVAALLESARAADPTAPLSPLDNSYQARCVVNPCQSRE